MARQYLLAIGAALLFMSLGARYARAEENSVSADMGLGLSAFDDGPGANDDALFVDLGLSWRPLDYVALRACVGLLEGFDRHFAPQSYGRFRAEAALRYKWWKIEPMLGGGGMLIGVSPSAYGLGAVGIELARGWSLTVEARVGRFWDQHDTDVEENGFLEGQLGLSVMLW